MAKPINKPPIATFLLTNADVVIGDSWQRINGVCANPLFFSGDLSTVIMKIAACCTSDGDVEFRIVESNSGVETVLNSTVYTLATTGGSWEAFMFQTDVAPTAPTGVGNDYRLEAKRTTATTATLRSATFLGTAD